MTEKDHDHMGQQRPSRIRVAGKDLQEIEKYATKIMDSLKAIPYLRERTNSPAFEIPCRVYYPSTG